MSEIPGMLISRKTPHNDVVKLLTELVTELRIENQDLKQMLINQRSLMCGSSCESPELYSGQASGRPEWQKRLPSDQRQELDRMASDAHRSQEAYDRYVAYTDSLRRNQAEGNMG